MSDYDPIAAAGGIVARLAATSASSEVLRKVDGDAIAAMREAGLARLLTPKRFGGYELPPSAHIRTCTIAAHGCSAAAWVHMVCGAHTFVLGRYPERCQQEVFGDTPDVLIPGTLAPQGIVRRVDGGWLLNGRWQFGSGVDHGPWLLIGAKGSEDASGKKSPATHVVVPTDAVAVVDTWHTLGMRGTGSKDIVAEDVFVPEHRAMPTMPLFMGTFEGEAGPLYRLPVMAGLASMLAAAVLGMAEAGLQGFVEATRVRSDVYFGGSKAAKSTNQVRIGEAGGELDLARMLIDRNCDLLDDAMAREEAPVSLDIRVKLRWNAAYAIELCRRATERIYAVAGAHAIYNDSPLQRLHRDINTACHHAIADFDGMAEARGKFHLDLRDGLGLL